MATIHAPPTAGQPYGPPPPSIPPRPPRWCVLGAVSRARLVIALIRPLEGASICEFGLSTQRTERIRRWGPLTSPAEPPARSNAPILRLGVNRFPGNPPRMVGPVART